MDLHRHIAVFRRWRLVMAVGFVLACVLALLASYNLSLGGGPLFAPRGTEEWTSKSRLLVTQNGFPEGRTTLPGSVPGETPQAKTGLQFADPNRFSALAALYAVISYSDQVRARLPGRPKPDQIQAVPLDLNGQGAFLPIIEIATVAGSEGAARQLNVNTVAAFGGLLREQQTANHIPPDSRVILQKLNYPSRAVLTSGRSHTTSILVFMICIFLAGALAHGFEAIDTMRRRRSQTQADTDALEAAYRARAAGDPVDSNDWLPSPERVVPPSRRP